MPIYLCTCCGCSRYSAFSWDIYLESRVVLADFPHIPRTCTTFACVAGIFYFGDLAANLFVHMPWMLQEFCICPGQQGLFLSGFLDTTSCRCSGVSQDIYPDTKGCFFRVFVHPADAQEIPHFPGPLTQTQGLLFSGFPHTTSCRCSNFSWDIYMDMGFFFSGFSAHYIMQMLWFFSGHLHRHRGCFLSGFPHSWNFWYHCSQVFLSLTPRYTRIQPIFSPIADSLGCQWNFWLYGQSNRLGIPGPDFGSIGTDMHWSHLPHYALYEPWAHLGSLRSYRTIVNLYCYGIIGTPASTCAHSPLHHTLPSITLSPPSHSPLHHTLPSITLFPLPLI